MRKTLGTRRSPLIQSCRSTRTFHKPLAPLAPGSHCGVPKERADLITRANAQGNDGDLFGRGGAPVVFFHLCLKPGVRVQSWWG
jgi:hypothetical protein